MCVFSPSMMSVWIDVEVVDKLMELRKDHRIVILSNRLEQQYLEETKEALKELPIDEFVFRPNNVSLNDHKFNYIREQKPNVVFDDDKNVVDFAVDMGSEGILVEH